ncbi:hypothetical protein [Aquisphaera insulae]|uniref:hypothetical protein n=1 Tax=Aquisphaera insulae TaxID=2712864 RepID=UPI0013ED2EDE|nr:hypothetical protein [Aquisphaera insulae]
MSGQARKSGSGKSASRSSSRKADGPEHSLVVSVKDDHLDQIDQIAQKLKNEGYKVGQVMKITGGITLKGSGDPEANKRQIRGIEGVEAVEAPAGYELPPPDSDVQ